MARAGSGQAGTIKGERPGTATENLPLLNANASSRLSRAVNCDVAVELA